MTAPTRPALVETATQATPADRAALLAWLLTSHPTADDLMVISAAWGVPVHGELLTAITTALGRPDLRIGDAITAATEILLTRIRDTEIASLAVSTARVAHAADRVIPPAILGTDLDHDAAHRRLRTLLHPDDLTALTHRIATPTQHPTAPVRDPIPNRGSRGSLLLFLDHVGWADIHQLVRWASPDLEDPSRWDDPDAYQQRHTTREKNVAKRLRTLATDGLIDRVPLPAQLRRGQYAYRLSNHGRAHVRTGTPGRTGIPIRTIPGERLLNHELAVLDVALDALRRYPLEAIRMGRLARVTGLTGTTPARFIPDLVLLGDPIHITSPRLPTGRALDVARPNTIVEIELTAKPYPHYLHRFIALRDSADRVIYAVPTHAVELSRTILRAAEEAGIGQRLTLRLIYADPGTRIGNARTGRSGRESPEPSAS